MYSLRKILRESELLEIYFPVQLSEIWFLNHIADVYRKSGSLSASPYRFDYWQQRKMPNHIFQMLTDLINICASEF